MTQFSSEVQNRIDAAIADVIGARVAQVRAAVELLDEGATVPLSLVIVKKQRVGWMIHSSVSSRNVCFMGVSLKIVALLFFPLWILWEN